MINALVLPTLLAGLRLAEGGEEEWWQRHRDRPPRHP